MSENKEKSQRQPQIPVIPGHMQICANCPYRDYYFSDKNLGAALNQLRSQGLEMSQLKDELEKLTEDSDSTEEKPTKEK